MGSLAAPGILLVLGAGVGIVGCGGGSAGQGALGEPAAVSPPPLDSGNEQVWTADSRATQIAIWAQDQCAAAEDGKILCLEKVLAGLIDQASLAKAVEVLETLAAVDAEVRNAGHQLAHGIGMASYRSPETFAETFAQCPRVQSSGCHHGMIQGYFLSLRKAGIEVGPAEVNALCETQRAQQYLYFQCAHGLGHGLMAMLDNHLPTALEMCDQASDDYVRENCYGGAFMELAMGAILPHHSAGEHAARLAGEAESADEHAEHDHAAAAREPYKALDPEDLQYPCNAVAEKYQVQCYTVQPSSVLSLTNQDVAIAANACDESPEVAHPTCFTSLGRAVSALALLDHSQSIRYCQRAAGLSDAAGELWCLLGVVENLVNTAADPTSGLRFCRAVGTVRYKEQCYRYVGKTMTWLVAPGERAARCAAAEPEFVGICELGAGLQAAG